MLGVGIQSLEWREGWDEMRKKEFDYNQASIEAANRWQVRNKSQARCPEVFLTKLLHNR